MLFGLYLNNKSNGFNTAVIEALAELMNGYIEVNRGANMETDGTKYTALIEKFKGDGQFRTDFPARKTRVLSHGSRSDGDRKDLS